VTALLTIVCVLLAVAIGQLGIIAWLLHGIRDVLQRGRMTVGVANGFAVERLADVDRGDAERARATIEQCVRRADVQALLADCFAAGEAGWLSGREGDVRARRVDWGRYPVGPRVEPGPFMPTEPLEPNVEIEVQTAWGSAIAGLRIESLGRSDAVVTRAALLPRGAQQGTRRRGRR
jgi:hypothetical protein